MVRIRFSSESSAADKFGNTQISSAGGVTNFFIFLFCESKGDANRTQIRRILFFKKLSHAEMIP